MSRAGTGGSALGQGKDTVNQVVGRYSAPFPKVSPLFHEYEVSVPSQPSQAKNKGQKVKKSHGFVVLKMNMELCGTIALPVSLFSFFRFFFSISSSSSLLSASFRGLASPSVLLLTAEKREPLPGTG